MNFVLKKCKTRTERRKFESFSPSKLGSGIILHPKQPWVVALGKLWDIPQRKVIRQFVDNGPKVLNHQESYDPMAVVDAAGVSYIPVRPYTAARTGVFTPDGERLITGHDEGFLCLWDVRTGRLLSGGYTQGAPGAIASVVLSRDGRSVLVGGSYCIAPWNRRPVMCDHYVRMWHIPRFEMIPSSWAAILHPGAYLGCRQAIAARTYEWVETTPQRLSEWWKETIKVGP